MLNGRFKEKQMIKFMFSIVPVHSMSHDVIEVVSSHKSIVVQVGFHKHLLDLFVGHVFSQIPSHLF